MAAAASQRALVAGADTAVESPFPIFVEGNVVKGFGRGGKQLGIPTANLPASVVNTELSTIPVGVYLGWAQVEGDQVRPMVMSLGWNPYFKNKERSGEVHIIHGFSNDFYGKQLKVAILAYIRPEKDYDSLDALVADIHFDIKVAERSQSAAAGYIEYDRVVAGARSPSVTLGSPTMGVPNSVVSLERALQWLAGPFTRTGATRELRTGITDAYAALVDELGSSVVQTQYTVLAGHILDVVGRLSTIPEVADKLAGRNLGACVLQRLRRALPSDQARIDAARVLWDSWISADPTEPALLAALCEWRALVTELGEVSEALELLGHGTGVPLRRWLGAYSPGPRIAAAAALASLAQTQPHRVPYLTEGLLARFQRACAQAASGDSGAVVSGVGYAQAAAAVIAAAGAGSVPLDLADWAQSIAQRLLDAAYGRAEPAIVNLASGRARTDEADPANVAQQLGTRIGGPPALRYLQMASAWTLLCGLTALQPASGLWRAYWARALAPESFVTSEMSSVERALQLHSRILALTHILTVLRIAPGEFSVHGSGWLVSTLRALVMYADNALDAPPPPTGAMDPEAPVDQLADPTPQAVLQVQLRSRILDVLAAVADVGAGGVDEVVAAALRLATQVMAGGRSPRNEYAARMRSSLGILVAAPDGVAEPGPFANGAWAYEAEVGVTSLEDSDELDTDGLDCAWGRCVLRAVENDWASILLDPREPMGDVMAATRLANAAVSVFGRFFGRLDALAQAKQLDMLVTQLNALPFNSHRYAAVQRNMLAGVYESLKRGSGPVAAPVARAVGEVARAALATPSSGLRRLGAATMGWLAQRAQGGGSVPAWLENQAIRSRDRFARAGAAAALGALYARAGSLGAHASLRQVAVLLHSLARDADPLVHGCAVRALASVALSAGALFAPYARDTFLMAMKLWLGDAHTVPLASSAMWRRGRDYTPGPAVDAVSVPRDLARVPPVSQSRVASGRDAALVHPDSTTHHGRGVDDGSVSGDAGIAYVCTRDDVDAVDARAALGRLVGALVLAFGPELSTDASGRTWTQVRVLLREMARALTSLGVAVDARAGVVAPVVDVDARWETVDAYVAATMRRLMLLADPSSTARDFLPLFVRQTLRPALRARHIVYHGDFRPGTSGLQRVAVRALDSCLRLYGDRLADALEASEEYWADWSVCDVVWETLALFDVCRDGDLAADLRRLLSTAVELELRRVRHVPALVEALCAAATKPAGSRLPNLVHDPRARSSENDLLVGGTDDDPRPLGVCARGLALAALVAVVDAVEHPPAQLLPDLLRAGYMAAASSSECPSPTLSVLGLSLLRRMVERFASMEDPAAPGSSLLSIYEAQLCSAFVPMLTAMSSTMEVPVDVYVAAVDLATSFVASGLARSDRATLLRVLALLAPQPVFERIREESVLVASQSMIVLRLALLRAWAVLVDYAAEGSVPRVLADALELHSPLLARMWMVSIRDAAVLDGPSAGRDVLAASLRDSEDCVPLLLLPGTDVGPSRSAALLLGKCVQQLSRDSPGNISEDYSPMLACSMEGLLGTDLGCAQQAQNLAESNVLCSLRILRELLTRDLRLESLFMVGAESAGSVPWLVVELWRRAVSSQVSSSTEGRELAMQIAYSLLSRDLSRQWMFGYLEEKEEEPSNPMWPAGLSRFGRTVVADVLRAWRACPGSSSLRVLALVFGLDDSQSTDDVERLCALWLSLWHRTFTAAKDSVVAATSLTDFVRLVKLPLAADMARGVLAQGLRQRSILAVTVVLRLLGEGEVVPPTGLFVDAFVALVDGSDNPEFVEVLEILESELASVAKLPGTQLLPALASEAIPVLARHLSKAPCLLMLRHLATAGYAGDAGLLVMATILMLLLSVLPTDGPLDAKDQRVAQAVVGLATGAPERFRQIVVSLSSSQPDAKRRLELALRSHMAPASKRPQSPASSGTALPAEHPGIVLKSDFGL
ncbi:riboflavin kinase [Coemansia sp. RSA 552]|nr:riboflavin kinase [Coemansia sp. RSA 552]